VRCAQGQTLARCVEEPLGDDIETTTDAELQRLKSIADGHRVKNIARMQTIKNEIEDRKYKKRIALLPAATIAQLEKASGDAANAKRLARDAAVKTAKDAKDAKIAEKAAVVKKKADAKAVKDTAAALRKAEAAIAKESASCNATLKKVVCLRYGRPLPDSSDSSQTHQTHQTRLIRLIRRTECKRLP